MRLSEIVQILARRLGARAGRVSAIASRLQHAGMVPISEGSRRYPPELDDDHVVNLLLAVVGDGGLGHAPDTSARLAAFTTAEGYCLADAVLAVLRQQAAADHVIIRQDGASAVFNGEHVQFGKPPPEDGALNATAIPGSTLAAIAAEMRGMRPDQADAVAAITRLRGI